MATPVQVFVRDASFNIVGQIEDFQSLSINMLYNDVGTWEMTLPADSTGSALLDRSTNPGGGIVVRRNGVQVLSGPARAHKWSRSGDTGNGVMTIAGLDDSWNLAARLIWPDPAHTIDAQANIWWTTNASNLGLTQPAETIMYNLVSAQMGTAVGFGRAIPNLTLGTNLARGYVQTVPKDWRFNTVLDGLQQMSVLSKNPSTGTALDELGFTMRQYPDLTVGLLQFQVFQSNDLSGTVRFSFNVGNLAEATYNTTAAKATYLITGAGQTADPTASSTSTTSGVTINKSLFGWSRSDSYYPLYAEGFQDQSEVDPLDSNAVAQLQQSVNDYWDSNSGQIAATFKAIDTTTMAFGTHYMLGDFVTVELPQITLVERVRGVGLSYTPDGGEELTLAVGTADGTYSRLTPAHSSRQMFDIYRKTAEDSYKHQLHLQHLAHLKAVSAAKQRAARAAAAKKRARVQPAKKRAKR